jgi:hypothetical protein
VQCDADFGHQLSICSRAEKNSTNTVLGKWPTWRTILYYVFIFIFNSLHVSSTSCSSSGGTNCVNTISGNCHSVYCRWPCRVQVGSENSPVWNFMEIHSEILESVYCKTTVRISQIEVHCILYTVYCKTTVRISQIELHCILYTVKQQWGSLK